MRCRCAGTQTVGDGSGCTWKTKAIEKAINASCLYERIDSNIEVFDATAKGCFSACPPCTPPTCSDSKMTDCYLKCYSDTSRRMTPVELSAPWMKAFQGARSRKEQQRRCLAAYPLLCCALFSVPANLCQTVLVALHCYETDSEPECRCSDAQARILQMAAALSCIRSAQLARHAPAARSKDCLDLCPVLATMQIEFLFKVRARLHCAARNAALSRRVECNTVALSHCAYTRYNVYIVLRLLVVASLALRQHGPVAATPTRR
eukprot:COSAG06_NODE_2880_length_6138_cov_2.667826_7_plen_262_part_00